MWGQGLTRDGLNVSSLGCGKFEGPVKHPSENGDSVSRCESGELRREVQVRDLWEHQHGSAVYSHETG